jgi:hypothetical protein
VTEGPETETSVTETAAAEAPDEGPADETPPDRAEVEPSEDDLFARLRRESEERAAAAAESGRTDDGATGNEPDIAELLVAAEAVAERTADDPPVTPPALPATGIRRGLVAHLTFDEGRGTVAMDTSGRGANGTVKGGTWTRGRIGGALAFDGVDDHVTVPGLKGWTPTAFTVAFWLKPDATADFNQQVGAPQGWGRFRFHTGAEGNVYCGTSVGQRFHVRPGTVTVGDWQHFAYTFDNGAARFYRNGAQLASAIHAMPVVWTGLEIGQNGAQTIDGGADDVRVYERALSADEVRTLADPVRLAAAEKAGGEAAEEVGTASLRPPAAPAAPVATGIRRGLLAHWAFDEGRGTVAADSSGHRTNAAIIGARWVEGRIGGALEFDGVGARACSARSVQLAGRPLTLSVWAKRRSSGAVSMLLSQGTGTKGGGIHIGFRETDAFTFDFWYDSVRTKVAYTDTAWHHWAATYDPRSGARVVYCDGVAVAADVAETPYSGSGRIEIGHLGFWPKTNFAGLIDDVRVYGRVLSPAEVGTLADPVRLAAAEKADSKTSLRPSAPAAPPATGTRRGLLAHWPFDEGRGTVAADTSGSGTNGAVRGARWVRGRIGAALEFRETSGNVTSSRAVDLARRSFTLSAWARRTGTGSYQFIMTQGEGERNRGLQLGFTRSDQFILGFWADDLVTPGRRSDLSWHHWAATYDARSGARSIYCDGVAIASDVARSAYLGSGPVYVGKTAMGGEQAFAGVIDDVRIYGRALSPAEIGTLADPARLAAAERTTKKTIGRAEAAPPQSPFDLLLAQFDALLRKGDYAGAGKLVTDGAKDPDLADHAEAARAAGRVCESLILRREAAAVAAEGLAGQEIKLDTREGPAKGKVKEANASGIVILEQIFINRVAMGATKRAVLWADISPEQVNELASAGGWQPKAPDDHVALAVVALHWRDAEAAAKAFIAAGDHPLVGPYRKRPEAE